MPPRPKENARLEGLIVALVVLAAVPAAAWLGQERLIFFPQPLAGEPRMPAGTRDLALVAGDGTRLAGHFVPGPAQRSPVLLCFGGNAEEISGTLADPRWPVGYARAGVNYRGYGASEGRPGEAALMADAALVYDAVAARSDVDPGRIVVVGRSLGSAVAARLAADRPVAAAILISPYDSLVEVGRGHYPWLPVSWLLRHRFDARTAAARARSPLLAIVAADDAIIPPARSRALVAAWGGPTSVVVLAGRDHNDIEGDAGYWAAIERFLGAITR